MTDATPRVFQTSGSVWLKDFEFGLTGLTVRKTGVTSGPTEAELLVLANAGEANQTVLRINARFNAAPGVHYYTYNNGDLKEIAAPQ